MNHEGESFRNKIKDRYGSRYLKLSDNLQKYTTKVARTRNHLKFLRRCRDNNVIPNGLRIRLSRDEYQTRNLARMKARLETARVQSRIKEVRRKLYSVDHQRRDILTELKTTFTQLDFSWLEQVMKNSEQKENKKVKERQIKKYKALIDEKRKREAMLNERLKDQEKMRKEKIKNEVIDLTKNGIDDDVKKYLALGPVFSGSSYTSTI